MSQPLPLASASQRLRRKAGRPPAPARPVASQASVHPATPVSMRVPERPVATLWLNRPRLLGLKDAARYVGVSTWTIRGWLADGLVARVTLPRPGGGEMDRLLIDVTDLDRLIEAGKGP